MANEKKPSIYYDRGTIGSQDELDEYGVWVKSEPQDLTAGSAGSDFDLPDIEELPDMEGAAPDGGGDDAFGFSVDESSSGDAQEDDLELPEFDISDSFGPESPGNAADASEDSSFTDISMDDFLDASGETSVESAEEPAGETGFDDSGLDIDFDESGDSSPVSPVEEDVEFDDIAAVDKDLRDAKPEPRSQTDLSTQLLMKIANELSSIKVELSSLKSELAAHTSSGEAPVQKKAAREEGGFFDEEEDEKIALTGDELNNILNTADFTEEAGQDATAGETEEIDLGGDFSGAAHEGLALRDDEIPSDAPFTEGTEEELILDENILDEKDNEVLKELRESGAKPMTEAPDDTSYLEEPEDNAALDEAVLDGPVLDETVLDEAEPDFDIALPGEADFDAAQDMALEEPGAEPELEEIGIDLEETPVDDVSPVEAAEDDQGLAEEELELDLDLGDFDDVHSLESAEAAPEEESFASVLPEGFVVEPDEAPSYGGQEDEVEILPGESAGIEEDALIDLDEPELPPAEPDFSTAEVPAFEAPAIEATEAAGDSGAEDSPEGLPPNLRTELKTVLSYMDQLLESLPEDKIEEFAKSEYYETYKKLFEELGLA
ncbi:MAG: hypothetical protein LBK40_06360 [Spirochaetaceae bacterium]|jgi:hypothetical protein|nr:hypothetical protein [Spirochaetaceae bacterium]